MREWLNWIVLLVLRRLRFESGSCVRWVGVLQREKVKIFHTNRKFHTKIFSRVNSGFPKHFQLSFRLCFSLTGHDLQLGITTRAFLSWTDIQRSGKTVSRTWNHQTSEPEFGLTNWVQLLPQPVGRKLRSRELETIKSSTKNPFAGQLCLVCFESSTF